jgi:hypothetical protein
MTLTDCLYVGTNAEGGQRILHGPYPITRLYGETMVPLCRMLLHLRRISFDEYPEFNSDILLLVSSLGKSGVMSGTEKHLTFRWMWNRVRHTLSCSRDYVIPIFQSTASRQQGFDPISPEKQGW